MHMSELPQIKRPTFPRPLALPVSLLPEKMHSYVLAKAMTHIFAGEIREGEMDFLQGRAVRIEVEDVKMSFCLTLQGSRVVAVPQGESVELTISGSLYDFLLLVAGREDPDTLFFHRHLSMQGDTDFGVHLKNFLSGVDMESLPLPASMQSVLQQGLGLYERLA